MSSAADSAPGSSAGSGAGLRFAPSPGAADFWSMVRAHASMETRLLLRNGEQLVLALVIPLLLLVGGAESGDVLDLGSGRRIDVLTPGVMALALMSTAFTSLAIATGFERDHGVLKRLGATPLPRSGLLVGKVLSLVTVIVLQLVLIGAVALGLGWEPVGGVTAAVASAVLVVLGTAAFAALGLLMAGTLRAEATLAAANLVYVVLLVGGAVVLPLSSYPEAMRDVVTLLPSGALADGLRQALTGGGLGVDHVVVLAGWAAGAAYLTTRTFRWE
jgi:ABC-2 type transport system permease protein